MCLNSDQFVCQLPNLWIPRQGFQLISRQYFCLQLKDFPKYQYKCEFRILSWKQNVIMLQFCQKFYIFPAHKDPVVSSHQCRGRSSHHNSHMHRCCSTPSDMTAPTGPSTAGRHTHCSSWLCRLHAVGGHPPSSQSLLAAPPPLAYQSPPAAVFKDYFLS